MADRDELLFEEEGEEQVEEQEAEEQEPSLEEELTKQINDIFGMMQKEEGEEEGEAAEQTYERMSPQQQQQLQQQTGLNESQLKEWINENALNDPFDSYKAFYERGVKPQIAGAFSQVLDLVIDLSKDRLAQDPSTASVWKKYRKEIEKEVEKVPQQQRYSDPKNLWKKAALAVKGRHSDELQQEYAKEKVDELLPYLKDKLGLSVKGAGAAPPNYAETNNAPAPKTRKKKVKVNSSLRQQLEKEASNRGMSYERYAEIQYRNNPGRFS